MSDAIGFAVAFWPLLLAVLAVGVGALVWAATGGRPQRPAPDWLTERPFAHRGLHNSPERPENSLAAIEAAVEAGFGVEMDVRLSADGEVVVIHDATLARATGDERAVADVTAEELRALPLFGTAERIPTLAEALATVRGRVPVLVEVKNRGTAGALEDAVVERLSGYRGAVAVMSFNPDSLHRFRAVAPSLMRGQVSGLFRTDAPPAHLSFVLRYLLLNWRSRPDFVAYELEALPCAAAHSQRRRGRPVLAWTAKDAAGLEHAMQNADGVISDPGGLPGC